MIDSLFGKHHPSICWQFRVLLLLFQREPLFILSFSQEAKAFACTRRVVLSRTNVSEIIMPGVPGASLGEALYGEYSNFAVRKYQPLTVASKLGILQGRTIAKER